MHCLQKLTCCALAITVIASCRQREGSPFDINFRPSASPTDFVTATSASESPRDWRNKALGNLLKLRTSINKEELERAIQYLASLNCGDPPGGTPIDIDTFYPMHLLPQMHRVFCGGFQLKNHNQICGSGPKARRKCVDVVYTDYDESDYFK